MNLTERMIEILRTLAPSPGLPTLTPNQIARAAGYWTGQDGGKHAHDGRAMAPAQRVIFPLTSLRKAGLVVMVRRTDGLSGTAYTLTEKGIRTVRDLDR